MSYTPGIPALGSLRKFMSSGSSQAAYQGTGSQTRTPLLPSQAGNTVPLELCLLHGHCPLTKEVVRQQVPSESEPGPDSAVTARKQNGAHELSLILLNSADTTAEVPQS